MKIRRWLWRLLSRPEYFPPVPPHTYTPWAHEGLPCVYCGKAWCSEERDDTPLTAAALADALGCFWNAAIGEAHNQQEVMAFAAIMAEGILDVAARLAEDKA